MVGIAVAALLFLGLLSCAGAQAPAPSPMQITKRTPPAPVQQPSPSFQAPTPVQQPPSSTQAPTPVQQPPPSPQAPTPVQQPPPSFQAPTPVQQPPPSPQAPTPVQQPPPSSQAPTPVQQPPPSSQAPPPTFDAGSPGAASPGPAGPDCFNTLLNLTDCLTYVTAGSNLTAPEKGCCPALAGLVESNPICLCQLFGSSKSFGIDLDTAKALKLPSVCKISTPPLSTCALLGIPVGAPGSSQMAPGMSPSGMSPSGTSPSENNESSSSFRISVPVFFIGLWSGIAVLF